MSKMVGNVSLPGGTSISKAYILVATVISWIVFGSMQELRDAETGCSKTAGGCGNGVFDRFSYWSTMIIGIVGTLILIWPLLKMLLDLILSIL